MSIRCDFRPLRLWCQKVLPLVYSDSLSYSEVLYKVTAYINQLLKDTCKNAEDISDIQELLKDIADFLNNFESEAIKEIVEKYVTEAIKTVSFGLSTEGYFVAYIPNAWTEIEFGTIQTGELYGHLTLSYD